MSATGYAISPANFHGWDYERESAIDAEIDEAIDDRIEGLESASGNGNEERELMETVMSDIAEDQRTSEALNRWLFEIWKRRHARTDLDRTIRAMAAENIGNLIGPAMRAAITAEVRKEFVEA